MKLKIISLTNFLFAQSIRIKYMYFIIIIKIIIFWDGFSV